MRRILLILNMTIGELFRIVDGKIRQIETVIL